MKEDCPAIHPLLADDGIVLFHDAVVFKMMPGLDFIRTNCGIGADVFYGTSSGAALVFKKESRMRRRPAPAAAWRS
jgi:hypothetical protein